MLKIRFALIPSLLLFAINSPAATLRVPADFGTIQGAVNAATPGDTILVAAGVYSEKVLITSSEIRLVGQGAIIDGTGLTGIGIHVRGTSRSARRTHVEIRNMTVRNFERGIVLENVSWSRLFVNETYGNIDKETGVFDMGDGIALIGSSENSVILNGSHDNGRDGILLTGGSLSNHVQSNHAYDNGTQQPNLGGCNIQLSGPEGSNIVNNNGFNTIVSNILRSGHWGICIGPEGGNLGNVVAKNHIEDHRQPAIAIRGRSGQNSVLENQIFFAAGFSPASDVDLHDDSTGPPNLWQRNRGRRFVNIPIAGKVLGSRGENFVTDLRLANSADVEKNVVIDFFASSVSERNAPTATRIVTVPPLGQTVLNDVVGSLFGASGPGALRLRIDHDIVAESRVLNDRRPNDGGTTGLLVSIAEMGENCAAGTLPMLSNAADFRTNIGFFNPLPIQVTLTLTARRNGGSIIGEKSLTVAPFSHRQTAVFVLIDSVSQADQSQVDFFVTYTVTGGPLFVYAAVVDNKTGDGIYVPGTCKLPDP